MKNLLHNINSSKSLETFFIVFLLCIFSFGALLVLVFGVKIYQDINVNLEESFSQTTALSYIASKVRQCNTYSHISVQNKYNTSALVLKSFDNNLETWIYCYDGYIYEVYIDKDTDFQLDDGIPILKSDKIDFHLDDNNLLTIYSYTDKIPMNLSLYIRCDNKGGMSND